MFGWNRWVDPFLYFAPRRPGYPQEVLPQLWGRFSYWTVVRARVLNVLLPVGGGPGVSAIAPPHAGNAARLWHGPPVPLASALAYALHACAAFSRGSAIPMVGPLVEVAFAWS